ncbi:hypothetical protein F9K33_16115 [bacterium]|nr:MAG: hypothetical protein F9K33_16115 [bacterium]
MTIDNGFKIDHPDVFVPWDIEEKQLMKLFNGQRLVNVSTGYYTIDSESLNGLKCTIGFHFEPRKSGLLKELEFFRANYTDQVKSYEEFQRHFEQAFGRPTQTSVGTEGFNDHSWVFAKVSIFHFVFDRFGPEEHMRIKRTV